MTNLEGPHEDERKRKNKQSFNKMAEEEAINDMLEAQGIPCDECGEKFFLEELQSQTEDDMMVCKYCKRN